MAVNEEAQLAGNKMEGTAQKTARNKKRKKSKADRPGVAKFARGDGVATKKIKDKKLKSKLKHSERLFREAAVAAAKANDWLVAGEAGAVVAEGMEKTWRFSQAAMLDEAEVGIVNKVFDLRLEELGPYRIAFTRNGRYMIAGGQKGHLSLMDWQRKKLFCEVQVRETCRDVCFLHNELFFAAAQKKYSYIYDKRGIEVHCLKDHLQVNRLTFLPHHFLLTSIGAQGVLTYQDTSTGHVVASHRTRLGDCSVMSHNPWNAVVLLGHAAGTVTMWTPNITTPVVKLMCHKGPLRSIAVDPSGNYLVTAGADLQLKVWDVRKFGELHSYFTPSTVSCMDVSQRGMLAVAYGRRIQVWKDALSRKAAAPYLTHNQLNGVLQDVKFCPYEDILGLGHSGGLSTMLVPGAGEPNYDSFVADPFQGRKARQEMEVHSLLDKLQPQMIVLNPDDIGQIRKTPQEVQQQQQQTAEEAQKARRKEQQEKSEKKTKMKGKNKPTRRQRKKQENIIEEKKGSMLQRMKQQGATAEHGAQNKTKAAKDADREKRLAGVPKALHRFYKK